MEKFIILLGVLFCFQIGYSQVELDKDPEAKKILDKVSEKTDSYKNLRVKFNYVVENKQSGEKSVHMGYAFLSGKKYKIIIPDIEIFSDGKTVWTYMKDAREITITEPGPDEESIFNPAVLFTIYKKGYKYLLIGKETIDNIQYEVIDLFPELEKESLYSKIRLRINPNTNQLYKIETYGKSGLNHIITVDEYKADITLSDELFTFNENMYPEDIELVDLR